MEVLGNGLGFSKVLSLNIQGQKYSLSSTQADKIKIAHDYTETLTSLRISPSQVWRDDLNDFTAFAQRTMVDMISRRLIQVNPRTVLRCPCGKVEFLKGSSYFSLRRRLFQESEGKKICKLCLGPLYEVSKDVCLFNFGFAPERFHAIPRFMETDLRYLANSFKNKEYLVSRSRVTHFSLNLPGLQDFDIDPDFLWSLMVGHMSQIGYEARYVIGSQRNLLACFLIASVSQTFPDINDPIFVIPPYLVCPKRGNIKSIGSVSELVRKFGAESVRTFMLGGLNWTKKEAVVDPMLLNRLAACNPSILAKAIQSSLPITEEKITAFGGARIREEIIRLQKGL
jgi:hypothetical protein